MGEEIIVVAWMGELNEMEMRTLQLSVKEQQAILSEGGKQDKEGKWIMPNGHQVLNKALSLKILKGLHETTRWGTQTLCDHFLRTMFAQGSLN